MEKFYQRPGYFKQKIDFIQSFELKIEHLY